MAIAENTPNPSTRGAISLATPLRAYLSESPQPERPLDADALVRGLIANAALLPDVAPGGDHFLLVALPPRLLEALAAHVPPAPRPMPLLELRA